MRALLLAPLLLLAAAAPRDWRETVTRLPSGAHLIGNPAARAKLVEYASYTCPHCAHFAEASAPVLRDRMIRSGSTSLEYRHLIRDAADLSAAILARCAGPKPFWATSEAIFAAQPQWLPRAYEFQQANAARLRSYPQPAQLRAIADGAGLTALVEARGLSAAAIDRCFADKAEVGRIVEMTRAAPPEVDSTPSFFVNGQAVPHADWAALEPALRARGAK
jgi:hypothetical protein